MIRNQGESSKQIILLLKDCTAHTSQVAVATAAKRVFKILPHLPYSSDLAHSHLEQMHWTEG